MDGVNLYVDGSCNHGEGIAAAKVFGTRYRSNRASLALRMTGSETADILRMVGGMCMIAEHRDEYGSFVLRIDSQNAIDHIFERIDPSTPAGRDLWPGIKLARALYDRLRDLNVDVQYAKVPSKQNLAHHVAKAEQEYRLAGNWLAAQNRWPLPKSFREVFKLMERHRIYGTQCWTVPQ